MTRFLLFVLGIVFILTGVVAPHESRSLLSDFLSINMRADLFRELLGLLMAGYALMPEIRITKVRQALIATGPILVGVAAVGIWRGNIMLLDAYIYASAGVFLLLGGLELKPETERELFEHVSIRPAQRTRAAKIRHAH